MAQPPSTTEFKNEVKDWLLTQDKQASVLFAARFALRSVPMLAGRTHVHHQNRISNSDIILTIFRATGIALSAGNWPDKAVQSAAVNAVNAINAAIAPHAANTAYADNPAYVAASAAVNVAADISNTAYAAADSIYTATYYDADMAVVDADMVAMGVNDEAEQNASSDADFAVMDTDADFDEATYNAAYNASLAASKATTDAANIAAKTAADTAYAAPEAIYAALKADEKWIKGRGKDVPITDITLQPLWPDNDLPSQLLQNWTSLKTSLSARNENWDVWTDWYEDRLNGKPLNQALELAIANLDPKKYWNQGAAITNAKIKELITVHTREPTRDNGTRAEEKQIAKSMSKPKSNSKSDFDAVINQLNKYKSTDTWVQGDNMEPLNMSEQELEILKHSLAIVSIAGDLPQWSTSLIKQLKGVLAVMEAITPIIIKLTGPLPKLWNGVLKKLQKSLAVLQVQETTGDEDE